jgi:hypothetical protein
MIIIGIIIVIVGYLLKKWMNPNDPSEAPYIGHTIYGRLIVLGFYIVGGIFIIAGILK